MSTAFAAEPPVDELPLRPIVGPEAPPPETPWEAYVVLAATALVALVALLVLAMFLRRRRRPPTPLLPDAWALAELDRVAKHSDAPERQLERIANILRRYLSLRFQLHAPAQTTEEFRAALEEHPVLPQEQGARVLGFLSKADLVKFAKAPTSDEEVQVLVAEVRRLIADTAQPGQPPPESGRA